MHVRLIHWNGPEGRERKLRLASLGHQVDYDDLEGQALLRRLRTGPPDAVVIDLSRMPSHGREVALWLRARAATRTVPLVFVDGEPAKVAKLRALLPDATYTTWSRIGPSLDKAAARPPKSPVVPPSSIYSTKPALEKLGVKGGTRVCLLNAPPGIAESLGAWPPDVQITARPGTACDLVVAFCRTRRELAASLETLAAHVARQTVWIAWPKKASGVPSEIDANSVRETGLASGWVDFKICALNDTWSGLAFKRRAGRPAARTER